MIRTEVFKIFLGFVCFFINACSWFSVDKTPQENSGISFYANPEPLASRQDVYMSMARAVKYNVDEKGRNLKEKISQEGTNISVDKMLEEQLKFDANNGNKLSQASEVLDFAVTYAVANLSDKQTYVDDYFYETAAQQLALQAIKTHQKAWAAKKNIKELSRLYKEEQKVLDDLDAKEKKNAVLSDAEYDYRKNQEVLLRRISDMRNGQQNLLRDYAVLVKADTEDVKLEGRRFYELENFDEDYSIDLFQEVAVRNRKEFALIEEKSGVEPYLQIRSSIMKRYPLVSRLDVNGLQVENEVYEKELYEKAVKVAKSLLTATNKVKSIQIGNINYMPFWESAFDELGVAILTQSEVDYQLVKLADVNCEVALRAEKELIKEIKRIEKIKGQSSEDRLSLLNLKIALNEMRQQQEIFKAERAVALRKLYFDAGLSPLSIMALKNPINGMAAELKRAFNQDLVTMAAEIKDSANITIKNIKNDNEGWAQRPNWLEQTVAEGKVSANKSSKPELKGIQLGSYLEKNNADADWKILSKRFPELRSFSRHIEPAEVGGKTWFRLIVKGDADSLNRVCGEIKRAGLDCISK